MYEFCHRCQGQLPGYFADRQPDTSRGAPSRLEDVVLFCPHCGAPQMLFPEHMRGLGDELRDSTGAQPPPRPAPVRAASAIDWHIALPAAAIVAGIGAVLALGALKLQALSLLSGLWVLASGAVATSLYLRQRAGARAATPQAGARTGWRIGLAAGLLLIAAKGATVAVTGVVSRFALHDMAAFDQEAARQTKDSEDRVLAWMAANTPANTPDLRPRYIALMESPEVRAGSAVAEVGLEACFILLFAATSGAFAGRLSARPGVAAQRP